MEGMMVQFTEGLPGLVTEGNRTFFATSRSDFDQELLQFYEEYLAVTSGELSLSESRFRFGRDTGKTFFAFLECLDRQRQALVALKGQITGPFTQLTALRTENDQLALYEPRLREVVVKTLALKAQWQAELLGRFSLPTVIFIDEPALAGFGSSAFISVSAAEISSMLEEVVAHIHKGATLAGVHVCANTDWSLFFTSSLDLINFDTYGYMDRFALYRDDLLSYVGRGGMVAWGIVPTNPAQAIDEENPDSLADLWRQQVENLAGNDLSVQTLFSQSLITPSCGCGTLTEAQAERVVHLTRAVSEKLRQHFNK
jgi:methionine synthase II (cobalamin-independent)